MSSTVMRAELREIIRDSLADGRIDAAEARTLRTKTESAGEPVDLPSLVADVAAEHFRDQLARARSPSRPPMTPAPRSPAAPRPTEHGQRVTVKPPTPRGSDATSVPWLEAENAPIAAPGLPKSGDPRFISKLAAYSRAHPDQDVQVVLWAQWCGACSTVLGPGVKQGGPLRRLGAQAERQARERGAAFTHVDVDSLTEMSKARVRSTFWPNGVPAMVTIRNGEIISSAAGNILQQQARRATLPESERSRALREELVERSRRNDGQPILLVATSDSDLPRFDGLMRRTASRGGTVRRVTAAQARALGMSQSPAVALLRSGRMLTESGASALALADRYASAGQSAPVVAPTPPPARPSGPGASVGVDGVRRQLAGSMVRPSGRAGREDAAAVIDRLALLPLPMLRRLRQSGVTVVVCRDRVTEHRRDLSGRRPPGWPAGKTFDDVMGIWDRQRNEIVIATREQDGRRVVPSPGRSFAGPTHGAVDLVFEEAAQALDDLGRRSRQGRRYSDREVAFLRARRADAHLLSGSARGSGALARTRTFAASFARYMQGDRSWPGLYEFWANKFAAEARAATSTDAPSPPARRRRTPRVTHTPSRRTSARWSGQSFGSRARRTRPTGST